MPAAIQAMIAISMTMGTSLPLVCPPVGGSTPGVAVRFTVAVGTGVSLGGFSGGGIGVSVSGGGTGVSVGGGGGVGVKPADAGAGRQAINTKATTPKIRILGKIRCGICVCLLSSRNGRAIIVQEHMGKSRLRILHGMATVRTYSPIFRPLEPKIAYHKRYRVTFQHGCKCIAR